MKHLDIHFLNVGHGDCTFIDHPSGRLTMIDINNSKSLPITDEIALASEKGLSLEVFKGVGITIERGKQSWESYYQSILVDPCDYYDAHFVGRPIFRYIQTHPDMDHMSGLCRFFWQKDVSVENFWDPEHAKEFDQADFEQSPYDWNDWLVYRRMRTGKVQDGDPHTVLNKRQGAVGDYWSQDGVSVLSPNVDLIAYCNAQENWNNVSYILRVDYAGRRVILPGDAEKPAWDAVEAHVGSSDMRCDILKAAHHGRKSGYSESATAAMTPKIVVCSVGKKPDTDASGEYRDHGADVFSTRSQGSIVARIWEDGEAVITNHRGENSEACRFSSGNASAGRKPRYFMGRRHPAAVGQDWQFDQDRFGSARRRAS